MDFVDSLELGKIHEYLVCAIIRKKYPNTYVIEGYCKEYDIFVPEINIGVEVKVDMKSLETGNIVIEIEFDGKPSALSTTKAEYWAIFDNKYHWFRVSDIKMCVKDLHPVTFVGNGDTKKKKAYLVKKELLFSYEL